MSPEPSQGSLVITLILAMVLCIVLGCGVPSSAAYALVAILVVPGIVKMGVDPFQIHFFCFYFAVISCITPPVAVASLGAASIADSNYTRTGWEALKMAATGFVLPFFFVANPALLLRGDGVFSTILSIAAAVLAVVCFSYTAWGYCYTLASTPQRVLSCAAAVCFSAYVIVQNPMFLGAGAILLVAYWVWQKSTAKMSISLAK